MLRRDFLKKISLSSLGLLALRVLNACGGTTSSTITNHCSTDLNLTGTIQSNHGHTLTIPHSALSGGADVTYHIQGTANHDHTITITVANFTSLASNTTVGPLTSSATDHTHAISIICG